MKEWKLREQINIGKIGNNVKTRLSLTILLIWLTGLALSPPLPTPQPDA
jgi:hypothetical protein